MYRFTLLFIAFCLSLNSLYSQHKESPSRLHSEKDWTTWPKAIIKPDTVKKLLLNQGGKLDTLKLKKFTALKGIIIEDIPLENLQFLSWFPKLETIEIKGNSLKTLEGIEQCKTLKEVSINNNFIQDISLLRDFNFRFLMLYENEISDISVISGMSNLEFLELGLNPITSIDSLYGLIKLKTFSVYECTKLRDISVIENFTELTDLNISLLKIPDLSLAFIRKLKKIDNLRIQGVVKNNEEIENITHLTGMIQLTMGLNDSVTSIESLYEMSKLEYLDIHSNNIESINVIRNFPRLIKFIMYKNRVTDISPLESRPLLQTLYLQGNPVEEYSPLLGMKALKYLDLSRDDFDEEKERDLRQALPKTAIGFW